MPPSRRSRRSRRSHRSRRGPHAASKDGGPRSEGGRRLSEGHEGTSAAAAAATTTTTTVASAPRSNLRRFVRRSPPPFYCGDSPRFAGCATNTTPPTPDDAVDAREWRWAANDEADPAPAAAVSSAVPSAVLPAAPSAAPAAAPAAAPSAAPAAVSPPCPGGASFVSLLTDERFALAAVCLRKQLALVRSACRHVLVHDMASMQTGSRAAHIRSAYGEHNLIALESLVARAAEVTARARHEVDLSLRARRVAGRLTESVRNQSSTAAARRSHDSSGRSSVSGSGGGGSGSSSGGGSGRGDRGGGDHGGGGAAAWALKSLSKLWLWALDAADFPLVCFLDLDVLVRTNIDAVLDTRWHRLPEWPQPGAERLAAVPALGCRNGRNVFNAAVLVFRPSLATLERLLRRERSFDRVGQACENTFTDQSILNAEYRGTCVPYEASDCSPLWTRLPLSLNVNVQLLAAASDTLWAGAHVAVIHFAGGYAKPWNPEPPRSAPTREKMAMLDRERRARNWWKAACNLITGS